MKHRLDQLISSLETKINHCQKLQIECTDIYKLNKLDGLIEGFCSGYYGLKKIRKDYPNWVLFLNKTALIILGIMIGSLITIVILEN